MVIQEHGRQHVDRQLAAILAHQRPLTSFMLTVRALHQHRLTRWNALAQRPAQRLGAGVEFHGHMQTVQGHMPKHLLGLEAQHLFGTGIEGVDHTAQVSGNDRHLSRRIQHAAQLPMGATQLLLTGTQLNGALLHQFQCALALADQHVKQRTEQGAEQHAHRQNGVHRRMVGPVEHFAGAQAKSVDMIAQGEAACSRQATAAQRVTGRI